MWEQRVGAGQGKAPPYLVVEPLLVANHLYSHHGPDLVVKTPYHLPKGPLAKKVDNLVPVPGWAM